MGSTNLIDLCSSPPFKIALVPPSKVEKVILARVVWLKLLHTDHGVTEEGKPKKPDVTRKRDDRPSSAVLRWIAQE
jgi:hypothetical protein